MNLQTNFYYIASYDDIENSVSWPAHPIAGRQNFNVRLDIGGILHIAEMKGDKEELTNLRFAIPAGRTPSHDASIIVVATLIGMMAQAEE
jgi:hypothetical protein